MEAMSSEFLDSADEGADLELAALFKLRHRIVFGDMDAVRGGSKGAAFMSTGETERNPNGLHA